MKTKTTLAAVTVLLIGMLAVPAAAHAGDAGDVAPDREVAYALAHEEGGYATGDHTAYWPKTGMQFTSSQAVQTMSVGSCATGSVCAYSGTSLTGSKLSWSTCSTFSTSALGSVGSIANARGSGTLNARNGATVVAIAGAGGQANVWSTVTNVQCL